MNSLADAGMQGQAQLLATAKTIARNLFLQTSYETNPYRSDTQYVTDLYYTYLQRGPDDGGLGWWTPQAAGGVTNRMNVLNAFEASGEFATIVSTLYGTAGGENQRTESFVRNFYLAATGAEPSSQQLQDGRNAIDSAANGSAGVPPAVATQAAAETFGRNLFASQVTSTTISTTTFVTNLYEGFLQRGPDTGGLNWWVSNAGGEGSFNATARQNVLNAFADCDAFQQLSATLYREVYWLVGDHLGTPRMLADRTGTLAGIRRHDYLPFGEEIPAGVGPRSAGSGYPAPTSSDSVRQKFTGYERDSETVLDFAQARYYSSPMGRFTSVDPLMASASIGNPQSFNRYAYALNSPTNVIDPSGMIPLAYGETSALGQWAPNWGDAGVGGPGGAFTSGGIEYSPEIPLQTFLRLGPAGYGSLSRWFMVMPEPLQVGHPVPPTGPPSVDAPSQDGVSGDAQEAVKGPFVISLPPDDPTGNDLLLRDLIRRKIGKKVGDGDCAVLCQSLAEAQGTPMGKAGYGRWRKGPGVLGNTSIERGTVIASGWLPGGFYPSYTETGCHAAIFLKFSRDGFWVLEQVRKQVQLREIRVGGPKTYFSDPRAYNVVMVGPRVKGMPLHQGARP